MSTKAANRATWRLVPLRRIEGLPSEMSDEALLAACALGDGAALGALYDRFTPHVWRFLSRITGTGTSELEDIVQATFIAVHRAASSFKGNASVRTWIFAIAANVAHRHRRDEVRRKAAMERLSRLPATTERTPDESLERKQLMSKVREALSALPYRLRVSIVMCDLEEISGRDAAEALAIPQGTLYRRVHEARLALRAFIEEGLP